MLEQKPSSEQKVETQDSSSPNSTNALVVGSPSLSDFKEIVKRDIIIKNCVANDDYMSANSRINELRTIYHVQPFVDGSLVQHQSRYAV